MTPEEFVSRIEENMGIGAYYSLFKTCREFIDTYPGNDNLYLAYLGLGNYYSAKNNSKNAIANFSTALESKSIQVERKSQVYFRLSLEYIKQKDYQKALEFTGRDLQIVKNIDDLCYLYYQKGVLENRLKKFQDALISLQQSRRLRSDDERMLVSIMLEEGYSQQNLHAYPLAELIYREIIDKFGKYEYETGIAKESLEKIAKVRVLENQNQQRAGDFEKILQEERLFFN